MKIDGSCQGLKDAFECLVKWSNEMYGNKVKVEDFVNVFDRKFMKGSTLTQELFCQQRSMLQNLFDMNTQLFKPKKGENVTKIKSFCL